jgi:hypothetical protein
MGFVFVNLICFEKQCACHERTFCFHNNSKRTTQEKCYELHDKRFALTAALRGAFVSDTAGCVITEHPV